MAMVRECIKAQFRITSTFSKKKKLPLMSQKHVATVKKVSRVVSRAAAAQG